MNIFKPVSEDEVFYSRALAVLVGPSRRMSLALRTLNAAYWLAMITAVSWLGVQVLHRPTPIVGRHQAVVTPAVRAGEPIKVAYRLTRMQVCATDVSWSEIDGRREMHRFGPIHVASAGDVGPDAFVYPWPTAQDANPGPSRLRVVLEFNCPGNYVEAFYPATEVLPEIEYETLPRDDHQPGAPAVP